MVPKVEVVCVIGCNASLNVLSAGRDDISGCLNPILLQVQLNRLVAGTQRQSR
jgi:hypothetical protein